MGGELDSRERIIKNNNYYDLYFDNVRSRTDKRDYSYLFSRFTTGLSKEGLIIDIGCGTGSHLAYFQSLGYQTLGIEPSKKSRDYCNSQNLQVIDGSFETIKQDLSAVGNVIGIWCAASLLHVPLNQFEDVIESIYGVLEKEGRFFFSIRLGEGQNWDKYDDVHSNAERFIQLHNEDYLERILKDVGFYVSLKLIEDSYWGRPTKWISIIATKHG